MSYTGRISTVSHSRNRIVHDEKGIERLFQRVVEDDYTAFETIFNSSYRSLCLYSRHLVLCPQLAEEIVDDVFCSLWNNRKTININTSFRAYLIASIRNRCFDSLRQGKPVKIIVLDQAHSLECKQSIASDNLIYDELRSRIDLAVSQLPKQCRIIFRMSRYRDLSHKDIAVRLKISTKTVENQIGRALKHIRKCLASDD